MRTVSRTLQCFIAILIVVVGLSAASVRVLFPNADRYRGDLERWLAGIAGQPVAIGSLEAEWRGLSPQLRVTDLRLRDPAQYGRDGAVNAHFESATVTVDVIASLLGGELSPRHIHMGDVTLRVHGGKTRDPDAALRAHLEALLAWALAQDRLHLDATRVELSDIRVAGDPLGFTNLRLSLRNDGNAHDLDAAVELPGEQGAMSARATLDGNPASEDWNGNLALAVEDLDVATVKAWRHYLGSMDVGGRVSLSIDSRWESGVLAEASGDVAATGLRVRGDGGRLGPLNGEARLSLTGRAGDWQLDVMTPTLRFLSFRDPGVIASLRYVGDLFAPGARIDATVASMDLADLIPVLPLALEVEDEAWRKLEEATPGGRIRDLAVSMVHDVGGFRDVEVAGAFHGVGIRGGGSLPSLAGLAGSFEHGGDGTRLRLVDGGILASLPEWFPEPIAGQALRGEILWTGGEGERRLTLSEVGFDTGDVTTHATGEILWSPGGDVPYLDLSVAFQDGDLERLEYFIPTHIFGDETGPWLDQAFPRGRLTSGSVTLRGRPPRELVKENDFRVTVHAEVQGATVHYLDGWPAAERVSGSVHIADRRLVATVSEGRFFDARMRPNRFVIADILADDPVFDWSARIDGTAETAMRFLRDSPLRESFRSLVDNVDASGRASLAFDLRLAIASGVPTIDGSVDVADATLAVPSLREGFHGVRGRVGFDQDGIRGEDITGAYLGRPVTAAIETMEDRDGHTKVRIAGEADADYVALHLHNAGLLESPDTDAMPILARLEGGAPWEATVNVLERAGPGEAPVVLRVTSTLEGAAVTLPAPFGKPAEGARDLAVEARFADADHRQMRLRLGDEVAGVFELQSYGGGYRLDRGAVRLGGGPAVIPDDPRIHVSGRIREASMGDWSALVLKPRAEDQQAPSLAASVDIGIGRLAMLGGEFADVHIRANGAPAGDWRIAIAGPAVRGNVSIPVDLPEQPVRADFDRLALSPVAGQDPDITDPRRLPPMRFSCARCRYGDMDMRDVAIVTSRRVDGLSIDSLRFATEGFEAGATGAWTLDPSGGQRTRLDVRLGSDDLGRFLAALGHRGGTTRGGATEVNLSASWAGPPSEFGLDALDGELHFRAGKGMLTDVSRGTTGRLFGVLLVPDLPRRLKGDFSDLFEDGFAYRGIEGTFNIEQGNAYTNDLTLDGSLARIEIAGRTGLADEDYDQVVTVTPKLSDSVPLLPIWIVEKAIDQELVNQLFAYQYTITGSWDDPAVSRVVIENDLPKEPS